MTEAAKQPCPHDDWEIRGNSPRNFGTCTKCGAEELLNVLWNNWKARLEREIKQALESNQPERP